MEIGEEIIIELFNPNDTGFLDKILGYMVESEFYNPEKIILPKLHEKFRHIKVRSISPSQKYVLCHCCSVSEDLKQSFRVSSLYTVLRKEDIDSDKPVFSYCASKDVSLGDCEALFDFEWFEEYGFVKLIICNLDTFEPKNQRIYFDKELYNSKKPTK